MVCFRVVVQISVLLNKSLSCALITLTLGGGGGIFCFGVWNFSFKPLLLNLNIISAIPFLT